MPITPIDAAQQSRSAPIEAESIDAARRAGTDPTQAPRELKQTMDGEVFLKLLVTQLTNQDPSSPMDTNDMIAQTTQLASMEQLSALAQSQQSALGVGQRTAAAALIGQSVTTTPTPADPAVTGIVTSVTFGEGEPQVLIDGNPHPYSSIAAVAAAAAQD